MDGNLHSTQSWAWVGGSPAVQQPTVTPGVNVLELSFALTFCLELKGGRLQRVWRQSVGGAFSHLSARLPVKLATRC